MSDLQLAATVALGLGVLYLVVSPDAIDGAGVVPPHVPAPTPSGDSAGSAAPPAPSMPRPGITDVGSVAPGDLQIVGAIDCTGFAESSRITAVHLDANGAISLAFDGQTSWPVVLLDAEGGDNIQYTIGIGFAIGGRWVATEVIQMWQGRPDTGAGLPLADQIAQNWLIRGGAPLQGYQPSYGEPCVLFAVNGNTRFGAADVPIAQRTNFVVVPFQPGDYDTSSQP